MKLLLLAPHYITFIKGQAEAFSPHVESIAIAIRYNPLAEISRIRIVNSMIGSMLGADYTKYTKAHLVNLTNIPCNIKIKFVNAIYLTPDGHNKSIGGKLFKKTFDWINNENIEFDLIHAHFTWPCGYAAVKLGQKFEVPVVLHVHENRAWFLEEVASNDEMRHWTWRNADAIIRVNKVDVPILEKFNKHVVHIPNGFDPKKFFSIEKFKARDVLNLPADKKLIFTFSALEERKGFQYLIESMNAVVKRRKDVLCYIGGSGSFKGKLESIINELGLEATVKLIGYVPNEQVAYWLNACDVFVLPSLSEGNPTVMFEALGCGRPFVGTRVGGVPEVIVDDRLGILVEPGDPEALAQAILQALEREWDHEYIRAYAQQFTWENIAREIMKIYRSLL